MEISSLALFRGIPPEECGAMMALGCVRTADFEKGRCSFAPGT